MDFRVGLDLQSLRVVPSQDGKGRMLITLAPIPKGELFARIRDFKDVEHPTFQTIQVSTDRHIEEHSVLSFLNHSCEPNVQIDTEAMGCRALKDIPAGSELSFFYPSTEWAMERPFQCLCGSASCLGWVSGARDLELGASVPHIPSPHIRDMLSQCVS